MKVLAVTVKVKKEKILEAKNFFKTFLTPSRSEPGCLQYDLFQSTDDPQVFYFFEKWKDEASFTEHSLQPFLLEFRNRYSDLLEESNKLLWLKSLE